MNICFCNNCESILIDHNPQSGAKVYNSNMPVDGELETQTDEGGPYKGCPYCRTDGYLIDQVPENFIWEQTDANTQQYCRRTDKDLPIFELVENGKPRTKIDLRPFTIEEIEAEITSYYKSLDDLFFYNREKSLQVIAECLFELDITQPKSQQI